MAVNRLDLYLQWGNKEATYVNTDKEQQLVTKFHALYSMAKSSRDHLDECNPKNLDKWRRAYKGTLNALDQEGNESKRKSRQVRKIAYEFVESTVDNSIPLPKMSPRYKSDLPLVNATESYLKYEIDNMFTQQLNDESERATYIDGTCWYKVTWDSMSNTHERSGDVRVELRTVDQIIPQPGVKDYRDLEYIFEIQDISLSKIYDLYGRIISPIDESTNIIQVVSCYYLNEDHVVGLFMWAEHSMQVICNERDWQVRKLRVCTHCNTINPTGSTCRLCEGHNFKYVTATEDILDEDLIQIYNPYKVGETDDPSQDQMQQKIFLSRGTKVPFYQIRQLPFVPRPAVSIVNSLYGLSTVAVVLEEQDNANKVLTKAIDKTLKSGSVVTKPEKMKIADTDETFKVFGVRSAEEAAMVQAKQIMADTSQDIVISNLMYESARAATGITQSYQGARDTTATSGKARQVAAAQSAGRIESTRVMKAAAFSGVYDLVLKYLLAFSDEPRKFTKVLPDGSTQEMTWNKYMFLDKDDYGQIYYRDDFTFSSDPAATLSQDRQSMWQETLEKFTMGMFGSPQDPRVLELVWHTLDGFGYPLASTVLAGIKDNSQHLPPEVEQFIMSNQQIMQMIQQAMQEQGDGRGGARPNSGPDGNGATHAANIERTNTRNAALNGEEFQAAQQMSPSSGEGGLS